MEAFVKSRNVCWVWSGMPGHVQDSPNNKITKPQYLWEGLSFFCLFVACSYTFMKGTVLSCRFSWVWSGMPKVF